MSNDISRAAHVVVRVGAGVLFLEHGLQKLFGMFGGMGVPGGSVPLTSQLGVAGILELIGGSLIILGLLTRPVAAVLVVEMMVAYFQMHLPRGGWPIANQGELALLYGAIFVFLAGNGAGPLSVDHWLRTINRHDQRPTRDRRIHRAA